MSTELFFLLARFVALQCAPSILEKQLTTLHPMTPSFSHLLHCSWLFRQGGSFDLERLKYEELTNQVWSLGGCWKELLVLGHELALFLPLKYDWLHIHGKCTVTLANVTGSESGQSSIGLECHYSLIGLGRC